MREIMKNTLNKKYVEELINRGKKLEKNEYYATLGHSVISYRSGPEFDQWFSEIHIFNERYLKLYPLYDSIRTVQKNRKGYNNLMGYLRALANDEEFWEEATIKEKPAMYDVFISHANKDKIEYVNELKQSLNKLGIEIFYDKDTLEWGDKWKDKILEGVEKAEFAIIVISENFFDREWTEKELNEFLSRQNANGQKIILPILHNITTSQLKEKYPDIADIQALSSSGRSCDEIALLFAGQLIKRLKA